MSSERSARGALFGSALMLAACNHDITPIEQIILNPDRYRDSIVTVKGRVTEVHEVLPGFVGYVIDDGTARILVLGERLLVAMPVTAVKGTVRPAWWNPFIRLGPVIMVEDNGQEPLQHRSNP